MNNVEKRLNLSKEAFNNTEELVKKFVEEDNRGKTRAEVNKLTDEFTIAFNGMHMLMSELDQTRAIELLDKYGILKKIKKSVNRIQSNNSLAFT
ncbi:MAG: hypothetical protein J6A59_08065 [Lachnospiraceae bacterium]|nr:hypothetical protein [Lachnospiraceae bacterium]